MFNGFNYRQQPPRPPRQHVRIAAAEIENLAWLMHECCDEPRTSKEDADDLILRLIHKPHEVACELAHYHQRLVGYEAITTERMNRIMYELGRVLDRHGWSEFVWAARSTYADQRSTSLRFMVGILRGVSSTVTPGQWSQLTLANMPVSPDTNEDEVSTRWNDTIRACAILQGKARAAAAAR